MLFYWPVFMLAVKIESSKIYTWCPRSWGPETLSFLLGFPLKGYCVILSFLTWPIASKGQELLLSCLYPFQTYMDLLTYMNGFSKVPYTHLSIYIWCKKNILICFPEFHFCTCVIIFLLGQEHSVYSFDNLTNKIVVLLVKGVYLGTAEELQFGTSKLWETIIKFKETKGRTLLLGFRRKWRELFCKKIPWRRIRVWGCGHFSLAASSG